MTNWKMKLIVPCLCPFNVGFTYFACRFYLPHGLSTDKNGNYWVTDVALHQVRTAGFQKYGTNCEILTLTSVCLLLMTCQYHFSCTGRIFAKCSTASFSIIATD